MKTRFLEENAACYVKAASLYAMLTLTSDNQMSNKHVEKHDERLAQS